jgi:acyl-CoA reductase-like NAD-dependent aldehyde dehydrogenase
MLARRRTRLPCWRAHNLQVRADILRKADEPLIARKIEVGELQSREEDKTRAKGVVGT